MQLVSVAFDDTEVDQVQEFFAENGGDWPVITAGADGASLDYGVKKLPESFLVDPSGEVVVKINGGVTADQLDALIAERRRRGRDRSAPRHPQRQKWWWWALMGLICVVAIVPAATHDADRGPERGAARSPSPRS